MSPPIESLNESFLYHIWDGSHLLLNELETTDGQRIEIIHRGKWNMDSGPDFIGAILKLDGQLAKGDVEIHTQTGQWFQHGHHTDPRYDDVILHAVLWGEYKPSPVVTKAGRLVPTLVLGDFLDESLSRLQTRVEKVASDSAKGWPEVCPLSKKENTQIWQRIEYWGMQRLNQKKERFKEERDYFEFNDLLYQGLCEALGYSKNRQPFLKLALLAGLDKIWPAIQLDDEQQELETLQGIYFGAAGFLELSSDEEARLTISTRNFMEALRRHWNNFRANHTVSQLKKSEWKFLRLRPLNFPTVRLAGLCYLMRLRKTTGFLDPVLSTFRDLKNSPPRIFTQLQQQFVVPGYGFWKTHVHFEESKMPSSAQSASLIGTSKSREIVINVVLPLLLAYAEEADDYELAATVKQTYKSAPRLQSNELTRKMEHQLGLQDAAATPRRMSACDQQGLIHLAKFMCPAWRCHECVHAE